MPRNLSKTSKSEKRPGYSEAAGNLRSWDLGFSIFWEMLRDLNKLKDVKKAEEAEGVEQAKKRS